MSYPIEELKKIVDKHLPPEGGDYAMAHYILDREEGERPGVLRGMPNDKKKQALFQSAKIFLNYRAALIGMMIGANGNKPLAIEFCKDVVELPIPDKEKSFIRFVIKSGSK